MPIDGLNKNAKRSALRIVWSEFRLHCLQQNFWFFSFFVFILLKKNYFRCGRMICDRENIPNNNVNIPIYLRNCSTFHWNGLSGTRWLNFNRYRSIVLYMHLHHSTEHPICNSQCCHITTTKATTVCRRYPWLSHRSIVRPAFSATNCTNVTHLVPAWLSESLVCCPSVGCRA